jgi:PKD repeat protein
MNDSKTTLNSNLIFFAQEKKTQQKNLSHQHLKRFFIVLILTSIFSSLSFSLFSQCNINGVPNPNPVITTSFTSGCIVYESGTHFPNVAANECFIVCENSTVTYETPNNAGSTYTWSVVGNIPPITGGNTNLITVNWGAPGNGFVTVTETNSYGCSVTVQKCVVVIQKPYAFFESVPFGDSHHFQNINVCLNQEVFFFGHNDPNATSPIVSWLWDFGDCNINPPNCIATDQNPSHSYNQDGFYTVTLTVTNECGCSDIAYMYVNVSKDPAIEIQCPAPVCANTQQTYYTNADCNQNYLWSISPTGAGTIISANPSISPYVTVQWGNGNSGPGILTLNTISCNGDCHEPASIVIPIISPQSVITGKILVCEGEQEEYSVPIMNGAVYTWNIILPSSGTIGGTAHDHTVLIDWSPTSGSLPQHATVQVNYINQFLNCDGRNTLDITILQKLSISADKEIICENDPITLTPTNPQNTTLYWTATDENGGVFSLGNSINPITIANWTYGSGVFLISAYDIAGLYCSPPPGIMLTVKPTPAPPTNLSGDNPVCPSTTHSYSAVALFNNYLSWTITGGSPPDATGSPVSVTWGATTPYILSVTQTDNTSGCVSLPASLTVSSKIPVATNLVTGPNPACANTTGCANGINEYTVQSASSYDEFLWSLSIPSLGSVTCGQFTNTANFQWNNVGSITQVYVQLEAKTCKVIQSITNLLVDINPPATLTIPPVSACADAFVQFTATSGYNDYYWNYGDGSAIVHSSGPFSYIGYHQYQNPSIVTNYNVTVTSLNPTTATDCSGIGFTIATIYPQPEVTISPNATSCSSPIAVALTAQAQSHGGNLSYVWSTGATTQTINVTTAASFTVTVYEDYGGIICSNTATYGITSICSTLGSCTFTSNVVCDIIYLQANVSSGATVTWYYGCTSFANGLNAQLPVFSAGQYVITMVAQYSSGSCCVYTNTVDVPLVVRFNTKLSCGPVGFFTVDFTDAHTTFGVSGSPIYLWTITGPSNFTSLAQSPSFLLGVGSYSVTLTVTYSGYAPCSFTINPLNIPQPTIPNFGYTPDPNPNPIICEKQTTVNFNAYAVGSSTLGTIASSIWDFGDITTSLIFPVTDKVYPDKTFPNGFTYQVTLTVTDIYNCIYSVTKPVHVNNDELGDDAFNFPPGSRIFPYNDQVFCPGGSATFSFNNQTLATINTYNWYSGINLISNASSFVTGSSGTYTLTVEDDKGCSYKAPNFANAREVTVPDADINGDLDICEGEDLVLTGGQGASCTYLWQITGPGYSNTFPTSNISISGLFAGPYTITYTIIEPSQNCISTSTVTATVHSLPTAPIITSVPAYPVCEGSQGGIQLTANIGTQIGTINWSTGATGPNIFLYNSGAYNAIFTDLAGCSATSSDFQVHPRPQVDFAMYGCFDICDTVPSLIVYGNIYANLMFATWDWKIVPPPGSGLSPLSVNGTQTVTDIDLVALYFPVLQGAPLPIGLYTVYFNSTSPEGCTQSALPLYITVKHCPCQIHAERPILQCLYVDANGIAYYNFSIITNVPNGQATVIVTSPYGGVSLNSANTSPITGIFAFNPLSADAAFVCFTLNFTSAINPLFNCITVVCGKIPDCGRPNDCDIEFLITSFNLFNYDVNGNPIYEIIFDANSPNPVNGIFSSQGNSLTGFPNSLSAGMQTITAYITDLPPYDNPLCIQFDYIDPQGLWKRCTFCYSFGGGTRINSPQEPKNSGSSFSPRHILRESTFINLIPNPAKESVTINYAIKINSVGSLIIKDTHGKLIRKINISNGDSSTEINLSSILPGVYFVSLASDTGEQLNQKLIIIK